MFSDWKQEKTTAALVDAAEAVADRLEAAPPHVVDGHAAAAQVWAARCLAEGQDLHGLASWTPEAADRFAAKAQTRITALRKARDYDSSDGLAIWMHSARAVSEPRIAPAVRRIWDRLMTTGADADVMAEDLLREAGLPPGPGRRAPVGFG